MGGLVIETVRSGVQFTPDAAAAFRRAEAQVRAEFGRNIDVNSTYRSWATQMAMYTAWNAYAAGRGPYPGHSKAVHPSESFHVQGVALDSDDWVNARIVAILAENGFIRNRLHVPGEKHHFEWIRSQDKNYGRPASGGGNSTGRGFLMALSDEQQQQIYDVLVGSQQRNLGRALGITLEPSQQTQMFGVLCGGQQTAFGKVLAGPIADEVHARRVAVQGRPAFAGKTTNLASMLAWNDEHVTATIDAIAAGGVSEAQVRQIADAVVKAIGSPTVKIDYAAIAKAVNDDAAKRLTS